MMNAMVTTEIINQITRGRIVINCFDKILVSYSDGVVSTCCEECIKKRFINTRKDRVNIRMACKSGCDRIFDTTVNALVSLLEEDDELIDVFGRRKVFIVDKNNLSISWEYVTPLPDCEVCGTIPDDRIELSDKTGKSVYDTINSEVHIPFRSEKSTEIAKRIETIALSKNFGFITTLLDNFDGPFPIAVAMLPLRDGRDEPGTGRTSSIEKSRAVALLEAIERYGGFVPRSKKTVIFKSYNELKYNGEETINFDKMILNQDSISNIGIYKNKKFYFYHDMPYHWVYGYDLTDNKSLLIPEAIAYYGIKIKGEEYRKEILTYEISNGCSVGANLTEAVYNGMLEVIERDAFLSCWYTDRSICRLILDDEFMSKESSLKAEQNVFKQFYNEYDIEIYEISCETHIPVILMTVQRREVHKEKMNFMCAAAADEDIGKAIRKAMHEISSIFIGLQERFESDYEQIAIKAEDMTLVENMDDHSLVWGYYKNLEKIHFNVQATETISVSEWKNQHKTYECLNKSFGKVIEELRNKGKNVIFVDQTTQEMRSIDMACAKVMIPGLLPMTFGIANVRISEDRIKEIEETEKRTVEVRFTPHPFP